MISNEKPINQRVDKTITIYAPVSKVWDALTDPLLMKQWMYESGIEIITDWQIGNPIVVRATSHWVYFENKGTVLQFEKEKLLQYSHLSSLSRLPDEPESYSIIEFVLTPAAQQTVISLSLKNFPTESIYKHLAYYWNVTLEILKKFIENQ